MLIDSNLNKNQINTEEELVDNQSAIAPNINIFARISHHISGSEAIADTPHCNFNFQYRIHTCGHTASCNFVLACNSLCSNLRSRSLHWEGCGKECSCQTECMAGNRCNSIHADFFQGHIQRIWRRQARPAILRGIIYFVLLQRWNTKAHHPAWHFLHYLSIHFLRRWCVSKTGATRVEFY